MTSSDWKIFEKSPEEREEEEMYRACRVAAVSYAAGRLRSSGQIRRKLEQEDFSDAVKERVLHEMAEEGYCKDREICRSLMRVRRGRKAESHLALQKRLERHLVPREIILEELDAYPSDRILAYEYLDSLTDELICAYYSAHGPEEKKKAAARLVRKAAGRGFHYRPVLDWIREQGKYYEDS